MLRARAVGRASIWRLCCSAYHPRFWPESQWRLTIHREGPRTSKHSQIARNRCYYEMAHVCRRETTTQT
eukprot:7010349-Pyramimonas_sp.AAC.1